MAVYFGKPQQNSGDSLATALHSIVQKKVGDLQRRHQIDERKATYKEANLPEWLAELPEDKQTLLLKEWQFLPEEEKQVVREHLDKTGESLKQEQNAMMRQQGHQYEQQGQERLNQARQQPFQSPQAQGVQINPEEGISPEQMQQGNQLFKQAPMQQGAERYLESKRPRAESIPGLNSLIKAGEGFQREPGEGGNETQMFPREGHGTKGQAGPMESTQPQGPKKYRMVPRGGGKGSGENQIAENAKIKKSNAKTIEPLIEKGKLANSILEGYHQLEQMNNDADLEENSGTLYPLYSGLRRLNEKGQEYETIAENIAILNAKALKGTTQVGKIEAERRAKPSLNYSAKARQAAIDFGKKQVLEEALKNDIYDLLVEKYEGELPDMGTKINKVYGYIEKNKPKLNPEWKEGHEVDSSKTGLKWVVKGGVLRLADIQ